MTQVVIMWISVVIVHTPKHSWRTMHTLNSSCTVCTYVRHVHVTCTMQYTSTSPQHKVDLFIAMSYSVTRWHCLVVQGVNLLVYTNYHLHSQDHCQQGIVDVI